MGISLPRPPDGHPLCPIQSQPELLTQLFNVAGLHGKFTELYKNMLKLVNMEQENADLLANFTLPQ